MRASNILFQNLKRIGLFFAKPDMLFYALPWLMILLIMGTVTQRELGLYEATQTYFNSFILWLGPIPTPGGLTTIGFVFISITVKFIFYSAWLKKRIGIILTHLGILLLLLGGIITSVSSYEGFMIIPEGRNINAISDYYERVLVLRNENGSIKSFDFGELKKEQNIQDSNLRITVLEKCNNCGARAPTGQYKDLQGLAQNMELYPLPSEKQKETNFSGLVLNITNNKNPKQSGTYMVMEDIPKTPVFEIDSGTLEITLKRKYQDLPFSITLQDFKKIDYPGTQKAKEFESDIIVHDGDISWPVTISMNNPLRYKGYTFYQSSFEQRPNIEVTVLNVVQNKGRAFPYISTLIIFSGLLIHLVIHLQKRRRRENKHA